jgi:hypothetical protein
MGASSSSFDSSRLLFVSLLAWLAAVDRCCSGLRLELLLLSALRARDLAERSLVVVMLADKLTSELADVVFFGFLVRVAVAAAPAAAAELEVAKFIV